VGLRKPVWSVKHVLACATPTVLIDKPDTYTYTRSYYNIITHIGRVVNKC